MAKALKRIEREFLLKVIYDDQIPLVYLKNRKQFTLMVEKPTKGQIFLKAEHPIDGIKINRKLNLAFDYMGQIISFSIKVISINGLQIIADEPGVLYKNLDRNFSRVPEPPGLNIKFTFSKDRYSLKYPKVNDYEEVLDHGVFLNSLNPNDLNGLIDQMETWIKVYATGYKVTIFKDVKPESIEEKIIAETGKAFYMPTTLGGLPAEDPYPKKRLVTDDIFKKYLENTGTPAGSIDQTLEDFVKSKHDEGIFSDLWMPILFQEYVVGHIHIWVTVESALPLFDYAIVDTLFQFGKVLAYSLRLNQYFEDGKLRNDPFEGQIIDISASGLLFAYPISSHSSTLMVDTELQVSLITKRRTVNTSAKIVRSYTDSTHSYFGCNFTGMAPEDMRFIFEHIYGRPFNDRDATFLFGQV
ncbi:MAG: PilZ domain-containing protein [Treponema sp.]|nr:PilZ domain-containing protein [Treponema sp.]